MLVALEPPLPDDSTLQPETQPNRQTVVAVTSCCIQTVTLIFRKSVGLWDSVLGVSPAHLVMRNSWFPPHCEGLRALLAMFLSRSSSM